MWVFVRGECTLSARYMIRSGPLPVTGPPSLKLIIGVWRNYDSGNDDRYRFNADGTWASSFSTTYYKEIYYDRGTWKNQGGNSYSTLGTIIDKDTNP